MVLDHGGHRTAGTCPHPLPQAPWLWAAHPAASWGLSSPLAAIPGHRPQLECPVFSSHRAPVFRHEGFPEQRDGVRRESGCGCSAGVQPLLGFSPWQREVRFQDAPQASGLGMTPGCRPPETGVCDQDELASDGRRFSE